ncbi:amino acid permease [Ruminococcus difficilis]|uniref:Circadian input-output histidine kinase CikA n=1 Tax=Ruminococcus difficilis TaxID=2763069 RepID=A0A934U4G0_9FIRM|nr:amino acid permease [Ruminococcus difficilis]MBK6088479.1 amino acid permease [Ruminococcus difficilis]
MIRIQDTQQNTGGLSKYLSPVAVWALAFGSAVGWGAFVMPGTTFLPIAGPWGSVTGLLIGAAIMLIIGLSYRVLMARYPDAGGSYTFAAKVLGSDHGFLCAWMLLLTYAAIIWANSTALALIVRFLFGDVFCFGFSYQIAGYTVYMGEVLLSVAIIAAACLVCVAGKRLSAFVQTLCAILLFAGIAVCFVMITVRRGGLGDITPAFSSQGEPVSQIMAIVLLAPWAFIGFESISHSAEEFRFRQKKVLLILIAALATGALAYIMLTLCAAAATPDGFHSWNEYISVLSDIDGIRGLPTFYAAQNAMGTAGLIILGVASFCGIFTGLIGNMIALSRLIYRMSADEMLPKQVGQLNKKGIPSRALWSVAIISMIIPFFGRTAIGWIVDVTTIGATVVYAYVSICAAVVGKREKKISTLLFGVIGAVIAVIFAVFYLLPHIQSQSELAAESYMILILWSLIGMILFRVLMRRDKTRLIGKSTVVWIILFCLILLVSVSWVNRTTLDHAKAVTQEVQEVHTDLAGQAGLEPHNDSVRQTNRFLDERFNGFAQTVRKNILILGGLLLGSLLLIFSIFSIIKKREQLIEAERLLAEENSRAKSAFLSNMSHDIRTPMNAITGYTALALKEEGVPESTRSYLEKIDTSGKQLLSLINDILDMSRIESGKMELDPAPADLTEILDETCHIFDIQMQAKPLTYTVDHSNVKHTYVVCDKNRLNRILLNLISNAYKYTPSGGSVSVRLTELEASGTETTYEISVSDTGIGMSPEFAEHIFDSFERERSQTVNAIQGTGLGMAITKRFVEMMNGTIFVQTEQGKGSTFTVRLSFPLAKEDEIHAPAAQAESKHFDFSGVRILLAEDNPINSEIACMILTQEGFIVDVAENGQIAAEMLERTDAGYYSAILMDIQMPVMNGYDATRRIRASAGENARVPIIAVTANTFEDDRQEAFDAGMNAHVAKPFNPDELIAMLAECIKAE